MASTPAAAAAANTNDDPAPTAAAEVVVGLSGVGGDGGQEDTCNQFAYVMYQLLELYVLKKDLEEKLLMLFNIQTDGRALKRFNQAAAGLPMDKVLPEDRTFKSIISVTDDRKDLTLPESAGENYELEVAVMASKFAYENPGRAKDLVTDHLQGRDFKFFDCPNLSLEEAKTTQAIGFVRKERGRDVVYVAFQGSDELNDWRANLDCGPIQVRKDFGKVHVGFMKALGLISNTGSFDDRFPNELPEEHWENPPAYYDVRQWLISEVDRLQKADACPDITVRVVGHSLGGALAILFVAMLKYHSEPRIPAVISSSYLHKGATETVSTEVITLGQPRVGDSTFANYMTDNVFTPSNRAFTYKRMVYSYDPVPRVPADDDPTRSSYSIYRHFGTCLYYKDWFTKQRFTDDLDDSGMDCSSIYLSDVFAYGIKAYNQNADDIKRASVNSGTLNEPPSVMSGRERNLFLTQFHTVGEYLNAAKHGREGGSWSSSLVRRLLRSLLHYPTSFWNRSTRSRHSGVIATTDHDDDVSSSYV